MHILDQIVAHKRKEIEAKKEVFASAHWENAPLFNEIPPSLKQSIQNKKVGIIAEHKRRSPSKAVINQKSTVTAVVKGYENAGAAGISVLTDTPFFGGSLDDLAVAKATVHCPLLRKEFIIDEYQILEAKAFGASAILLIAAILDKSQLQALSELAKSIGLEVLLEVHKETELQNSLMPSIDLLGVNNRNLKTFDVSLATSKTLAEKIPSEFCKVSESGISSLAAIQELQEYGYQGFLIGELFMKTENPGAAAQEFIQKL